MTQEVEDWLPEDAFTDERVTAILSKPLLAWRERWLPAGSACTLSLLDTDGAAPAHPSATLARGSFADAELSGDGLRALVKSVLDLDPTQQEANADDRAVLDGFAREVMRDLVSTLEVALPASGQGAGRSYLAVDLKLEGDSVAVLWLGAGQVAALIRKTAAAARPSRQPIGARSDAIRATPVTLVGHLGNIELALDDLQGIGVGDVLVLDRAAHEPVELRLSQGSQALARGRLSKKDGCAAIQL